MNKRVLVNIGLLTLGTVLILVVYLGPGTDAESERPRLAGIVATEVDQVFIRQRDGGEIVLVRNGGNWWMETPVGVHANPFRIDSLLRVTEAASYTSFEAEDRELTKYRLDPPQAVLRLNGVELMFGDSTPIGDRRYVRVGRRIHLIDDQYYHQLQSDFPAFVSDRLLPPDDRPAGIALPDFSLVRAEDGQWTVSPGEDLPMDAVNRWVEAWSHAQALRVERYEGGAEALDRIGVRLEDSDELIEFHVLESEPNLVLWRRDIGLRYRLSPDQTRRLFAAPSVTEAERAE